MYKTLIQLTLIFKYNAITILLILYGSFCLISSSDSKDYSKINPYKKIINAPLPSNGRLELFKWDYNSDHNKTNYKTIYINYFNEDTRKLEDNIKKMILGY